MRKNAFRYIVDDVSTAADFYVDKLGFVVTMQVETGFAALEREGQILYLNSPGADGTGADVEGSKPQSGGWNRIQIETPDLASAVERLKRSGANFRGRVIKGDSGDQALLEDPSGNLVELFEPTQRTIAPIPEGYSTVSVFIALEEIEELTEFLSSTLDARSVDAMRSDDGTLRHAVLRIGDSSLMVSRGEELYGHRPATLQIYVDDVDASYARLIQSGGESIQEPVNQFHGDRSAGIKDRWGNIYWLATHIEDVSPSELKSREAAFREKRGLS